MLIFATLSRMVIDDHWIDELYGSRADGVRAVHQALENRAWAMANELLTTAAQQEKTQLDEKLYLECFAVKPPSRKQKNAVGGARG